MPEPAAEKPILNNAFPLWVLPPASGPGYPSEAFVQAGNDPWPLITTYEQRPTTPLMRFSRHFLTWALGYAVTETKASDSATIFWSGMRTSMMQKDSARPG
ncbi:uncharacterized protein GLRG_10233 [Colletotrichum graminicola M1.001]|uniref:Uncharacterized protein n=1 Tax=Colletotrichum graminicola (strain M1.001 / M2 / FGSC 10212) TaxID=645133 RepID=E3QW55_COLGM|nr:uncharacterized protein GLRG_10233 [Colletotrichum graminicola M1.001]EFQ35089.1 hypothetical protein GLRG_10233 [Colletotrichum graminicola M1.001]